MPFPGGPPTKVRGVPWRRLCVVATGVAFVMLLLAGCRGDANGEDVSADADGLDGYKIADVLSSGVGANRSTIAIVQTTSFGDVSRGLALFDNGEAVPEQVELPFDSPMIGPFVWVTEQSIGIVGVPCMEYEPREDASVDASEVLTRCGSSSLTLYRLDRSTMGWSDPVEVLSPGSMPRLLGSGGARLIFAAQTKDGNAVDDSPVVADVNVDEGRVSEVPRLGSSEAYCPVGSNSLVGITSALVDGGSMSSDGRVDAASGDPTGSSSMYVDGEWRELQLEAPVIGIDGCYSSEGFISRDERQNLWLQVIDESASLRATRIYLPQADNPILTTTSANRELVAIEEDEGNKDQPARQRVWVLRDEAWQDLGSGLVGSGDSVATVSGSFVVVPQPAEGSSSVTLREGER